MDILEILNTYTNFFRGNQEKSRQWMRSIGMEESIVSSIHTINIKVLRNFIRQCKEAKLTHNEVASRLISLARELRNAN